MTKLKVVRTITYIGDPDWVITTLRNGAVRPMAPYVTSRGSVIDGGTKAELIDGMEAGKNDIPIR